MEGVAVLGGDGAGGGPSLLLHLAAIFASPGLLSHVADGAEDFVRLGLEVEVHGTLFEQRLKTGKGGVLVILATFGFLARHTAPRLAFTLLP